MAGTLELPLVGEANTTADPKVKTALETYNNSLNSENKPGNTLRWYTPAIVATEQKRESVSFGVLTTPDEVKSVVLPENGLLVIGYKANVKSSVSGAGRAAVFLGTNQLKGVKEGEAGPVVLETATEATAFRTFISNPGGLQRAGNVEPGADVTTGQATGYSTQGTGGFCYVFAAAGTYNVSVQFKATSGEVIAKERKLWVGVIGV